MKGLNSGENVLPTEFKNPFKSTSIDRIYFEFHKRKSGLFREGCFHKATVYFENGNTSGSQDFFDDDPDNLRRRVDHFINNLNN